MDSGILKRKIPFKQSSSCFASQVLNFTNIGGDEFLLAKNLF